MEEKKEQERIFELRSEKVRSIVGEVPSSLLRYGITTIGMVLLCFFSVAYYLPYKQVYSGTATVYVISEKKLTDSIDVVILLNFGEKRPNIQITKDIPITLHSAVGKADGSLWDLSPARDTLGRQEAICRMSLQPFKKMENSGVDFVLTYQSGNLLDYFFSELSGR